MKFSNVEALIKVRQTQQFDNRNRHDGRKTWVTDLNIMLFDFPWRLLRPSLYKYGYTVSLKFINKICSNNC